MCVFQIKLSAPPPKRRPQKLLRLWGDVAPKIRGFSLLSLDFDYVRRVVAAAVVVIVLQTVYSALAHYAYTAAAPQA